MLSRSGKGRAVVVILANLVAEKQRNDLLVKEERSKRSVGSWALASIVMR